MNIARTLLGALIAASTLAASAPSFADAPAADGPWACAAVTFSSAASGCYGSISPPPNDSVDAVNSIIAAEGWGAALGNQYTDLNTSVGSTTALIDAVGLSNAGGYVTFSQALTDPLVLVLKLGQGWSAYSFDHGVAAGDLNYAVTLADTSGLGLSHVSLFSNTTVTAVPEPGTYALMAAGLAAVAFVARRRKPA